jgi:glucose/arabinose dehydrogenase
MRLGWAATENSKRAHYLEVVDDKVLVISGLGQTIFFYKQNINKKKLNQIEIKNNIKNFLKNNDYELIGIRDLFVEDDYVYISIQHKDNKGFTVNVYRARLNFKELQFKPFFITDEYWQEYNVFSGGRIEGFKDNKILFSTGYSHVKLAAQDKDSLLGKIISIDKSTKKHQLISMGHRNPQGLFYVENLNLIINTEHGPKGGDEINLNFIKENEIPNYGWDISSYGVEYDGTKYRDSHSEHGFIEPFKYYTPSIGISELVYLPSKKNLDGKNYLFVSSLRAASIYKIEINNEFSQIINEDRIFFKEERIRDIEYDEKLGVLFVLFEYTPSIGILKIKP